MKCPNCGHEIKVKKKTMTPEALRANRKNAKKGGRPKKPKPEKESRG